MMTNLENLEYEVIRAHASNLAILELLKTVEAADGNPILSAQRYVTYDHLYTEKLGMLEQERNLRS
jgi:hypothetical protein